MAKTQTFPITLGTVTFATTVGNPGGATDKETVVVTYIPSDPQLPSQVLNEGTNYAGGDYRLDGVGVNSDQVSVYWPNAANDVGGQVKVSIYTDLTIPGDAQLHDFESPGHNSPKQFNDEVKHLYDIFKQIVGSDGAAIGDGSISDIVDLLARMGAAEVTITDHEGRVTTLEANDVTQDALLANHGGRITVNEADIVNLQSQVLSTVGLPALTTALHILRIAGSGSTIEWTDIEAIISANTDVAAAKTHADIVTGNPHNLDAADVGADPAGTAAGGDSAHLSAFNHSLIATALQPGFPIGSMSDATRRALQSPSFWIHDFRPSIHHYGGDGINNRSRIALMEDVLADGSYSLRFEEFGGPTADSIEWTSFATVSNSTTQLSRVYARQASSVEVVNTAIPGTAYGVFAGVALCQIHLNPTGIDAGDSLAFDLRVHNASLSNNVTVAAYAWANTSGSADSTQQSIVDNASSGVLASGATELLSFSVPISALTGGTKAITVAVQHTATAAVVNLGGIAYLPQNFRIVA